MRTVPTWVGSSDDAKIPTSVKLRIFARCEGKCGLSGRKIMAGDKYEFDHIKPLWLGGRHSEDNLHVVLADAHKAKSRADQSAKAKADRVRAKHLGLWPPSRTPLKSRGFPKDNRKARSRVETAKPAEDGRSHSPGMNNKSRPFPGGRREG